MRVQINGESRDLRDHATLNDLVGELSLAPARIAIELNHQVVRRDKWPETILSEDDRIEIVHFVGGGLPGVVSKQEAEAKTCDVIERFSGFGQSGVESP